MLMHYRHRLPANHDGARIRARVAARGPLWDNTPGLGFKAFLLEDRAMGAAENAYASLYLWRDPHAALDFLTDARFAAVIEEFGRPQIETWMPLDMMAGGAPEAGSVERSESPVPAGTDLRDLLRAEAGRSQDLVAAPDVFATISGVDPKTWRVTRFTLRAGPPGDARSATILHLARPGLPSALPLRTDTRTSSCP